MKYTRILPRNSFPSFASLCLLAFLTFMAAAGCNPHAHTSDPRLKQIDQMLDSQLPIGTSKARVAFYLNSQGFQLENTPDPLTIVPTVSHVYTETLQHDTALVTFHFEDPNNLKS